MIFRRSLFILAFLFVVAIPTAVNAQCVDSPTEGRCVAVHQSILDRAAKAVNELTEARKVIAAFEKVNVLTEAERAAYKNLAVVSDSAIAILQKGLLDRDRVIELQQKALELYADLVAKLTAKIDAPRSAWSRFLSVVKTIATIVVGVSIGKGLR